VHGCAAPTGASENRNLVLGFQSRPLSLAAMPTGNLNLIRNGGYTRRPKFRQRSLIAISPLWSACSPSKERLWSRSSLWSPCSPFFALLWFISLFDPLIQGLQHPCIHSGNHINRSVQFFFGHPCFPCVRKAPVHSRIAQPHHRYCQAHEHFLTVG
jgi:hypothetical protein